MKSIQEQIIEAKQEKKEHNKEAWFVDYCNNCKTGLSAPCDVPCHHPYYCWHDGRECEEVQAKIVEIDEYRKINGWIPAYMYEEYQQLRKKQRKLIYKNKCQLLKR